jgi:hypothetical protein
MHLWFTVLCIAVGELLDSIRRLLTRAQTETEFRSAHSPCRMDELGGSYADARLQGCHSINRVDRLPSGLVWLGALVATAVISISLPASAQEDQAGVIKANEVHMRPQQDAFPVRPTPDHTTRVFDRKFLLLTGVAAAATSLDIVTTSRCVSTYSNCQEANPLYGPHPSSARLYGVSFSILAGQVLSSAWLRREMPHKKLWIIPVIAATATHGIAAALNARTTHQLSGSR